MFSHSQKEAEKKGKEEDFGDFLLGVNFPPPVVISLSSPHFPFFQTSESRKETYLTQTHPGQGPHPHTEAVGGCG